MIVSDYIILYHIVYHIILHYTPWGRGSWLLGGPSSPCNGLRSHWQIGLRRASLGAIL